MAYGVAYGIHHYGMSGNVDGPGVPYEFFTTGEGRSDLSLEFSESLFLGGAILL